MTSFNSSTSSTNVRPTDHFIGRFTTLYNKGMRCIKNIFIDYWLLKHSIMKCNQLSCNFCVCSTFSIRRYLHYLGEKRLHSTKYHSKLRPNRPVFRYCHTQPGNPIPPILIRHKCIPLVTRRECSSPAHKKEERGLGIGGAVAGSSSYQPSAPMERTFPVLHSSPGKRCDGIASRMFVFNDSIVDVVGGALLFYIRARPIL